MRKFSFISFALLLTGTSALAAQFDCEVTVENQKNDAPLVTVFHGDTDSPTGNEPHQGALFEIISEVVSYKGVAFDFKFLSEKNSDFSAIQFHYDPAQPERFYGTAGDTRISASFLRDGYQADSDTWVTAYCYRD